MLGPFCAAMLSLVVKKYPNHTMISIIEAVRALIVRPFKKRALTPFDIFIILINYKITHFNIKIYTGFWVSTHLKLTATIVDNFTCHLIG